MTLIVPETVVTNVVVFHSWIAEYAKVANVTMVEGRQEVRLQEPLVHAPVGNFITSGGWRFLVTNNRAVLDMEGEVNDARAAGSPPLAWYLEVGVGFEEAPVPMATVETVPTAEAAEAAEALSLIHI